MSHRVVIAGGHGQIARHLIELLVARGDSAVALIRNPSHAHDIHALGGEAILLDLEHSTVTEAALSLEGADAAVFAAGAGPGSSAERKDTVDRGAAVLLAAAAERAGARRFIQISTFGAGEPIPVDAGEVWAAYLRAKTAAEEDLRGRDNLDWTILRPGRLTNDPPTGLVALSAPPLPKDEVPRADVAAVVAALIDAPATVGATLLLTRGATTIPEAVADSV
ncbi:NAD(P)-binding oxidoreductase [Lolliginicoccus suaedae]|uniref:NAD(P)-binding oxidoreductase n=1 Tax=Lolliginicoccus suaedae TaxID=2605429 RepID=UPI0011EFFEF7|nr:NAD(P)-binding oxidoreductase [Lolliginicoccus suaedae]